MRRLQERCACAFRGSVTLRFSLVSAATAVVVAVLLHLGPTPVHASIDAQFGIAGVARTGVSSPLGQGVGIAVQTDGKIVVGGKDNSNGRNFVLRFDAQGVIDTGFGVAGIAHAGFTTQSDVEVAIQPDGKVLLAGYEGGPRRCSWRVSASPVCWIPASG